MANPQTLRVKYFYFCPARGMKCGQNSSVSEFCPQVYLVYLVFLSDLCGLCERQRSKIKQGKQIETGYCD
jgi:hypothetical protein